MDWPTWVIPLIAVAIWVISNVARNAGAGQQGQARPAARPRANKSDIERFLEEINQRRRQQQQQPQQQRKPQPQAEPSARRPEPRPAPVRPQPQPQQVRRPQPRPRPAQVQPKPSRPIPEPQLLEARPIEERIPTVIPVEPPLPPQPLLPDAEAAFRPAVRSRALPRYLRDLRALFAAGDGMRTAVVLSEVLGAPRCRKPFRPRLGATS